MKNGLFNYCLPITNPRAYRLAAISVMLWFANGFASGAVPVIRTVTPNRGFVGDSVVIEGENFGETAASNLVMFGTIRAEIFSASSTSITVRVPSGAQAWPITVNRS